VTHTHTRAHTHTHGATHSQKDGVEVNGDFLKDGANTHKRAKNKCTHMHAGWVDLLIRGPQLVGVIGQVCDCVIGQVCDRVVGRYVIALA